MSIGRLIFGLASVARCRRSGITHCYSAHPTNTKRGVLIGLFLRALRLCSTEHLEAETEHITRSFQRLKYPRFMIQQALSTTKSRFYNPVVRERPRSKYHLQLPCHPGMQALRPALTNIGVSTSLSSSNTLHSHLSLHWSPHPCSQGFARGLPDQLPTMSCW